MIMEGLKIKGKKLLEQNVQETLEKYSGVKLVEGDILQCHRYILDEARSGKPRQIFIRFLNPAHKAKIMNYKQQFQPGPRFLRELLTTKQNSILFQAKEAQDLASCTIVGHMTAKYGL